MAAVGLGANLASGQTTPRETLEHALALLEGATTRVKALSRWWRTPAFPPGSGPPFVNAAALLEHQGPPETLLARLHEIEASLGRARRNRWEARVVDLDLLAVGDVVAPDRETVSRWIALSPSDAASPAPSTLLLPHPRLHERGFVLAPLADVAPEWRHPTLGRTVAEMLAALPPEALDGVHPLDDA